MTYATNSRGRHSWPTSLEAKQRWLEAWSHSSVWAIKRAMAEDLARAGDEEWAIALLSWRTASESWPVTL